MWRLFEEDDLAGQNDWDVACTSLDVPCFMIIMIGKQCIVRWQYDTSVTKHWKKLRGLCKLSMFNRLLGAVEACTNSRRAEIEGNVLGGTIEWVTLQEAKDCANALFKIISLQIHSPKSLEIIREKLSLKCMTPAPRLHVKLRQYDMA